MKLLITGASGRLGGALVSFYSSRHEVNVLGRMDLDLAHPESVQSVLDKLDFDLLINCAGITSPDVCLHQPELAVRVNAESPARMAEACLRHGARMIQISTDYVFEGASAGELAESASTEPVNHYGFTKLAAEQAVLSASSANAVARVSWLFGAARPSFPDQILRLAREGGDLVAVGDKWSVPTYVNDVAGWLEQLWQKEPVMGGVWHLCNSGQASWCSYAQTVVDQAFELGLLTRPHQVQSRCLDDFPDFSAKRPRHTVMSNARLSALIGGPVRSWEETLREWMCSLRSEGKLA